MKSWERKEKVKVPQSCLTLCEPMDYTVHGILQTRILQIFFPSPEDLPNPGIKPGFPADCRKIVGRFFSNWAIRAGKIGQIHDISLSFLHHLDSQCVWVQDPSHIKDNGTTNFDCPWQPLWKEKEIKYCVDWTNEKKSEVYIFLLMSSLIEAL